MCLRRRSVTSRSVSPPISSPADRSPCRVVGLSSAGEDVHQRRLAGPRRPHHGDELPGHRPRGRRRGARRPRSHPRRSGESRRSRSRPRFPSTCPSVLISPSLPVGRGAGRYGYPYLGRRGGDKVVTGIRPGGAARDVAGWAHVRGWNPSGRRSLAVGRRPGGVGRGALGGAGDERAGAPRLRRARGDRVEHHRRTCRSSRRCRRTTAPNGCSRSSSPSRALFGKRGPGDDEVTFSVAGDEGRGARPGADRPPERAREVAGRARPVRVAGPGRDPPPGPLRPQLIRSRRPRTGG